ncbi:hypothetical protein Pcinc_039140 [Petrolisthes cinctipes]|uniref:Uncharacterized protein n=1 Tax=Petrolisthes cinctipes TaxID=88211 RepID=A0AAE1BQ02_PETCI|nr:hypothetical protein Pcinc_039140 [Petrolisthes cinctipes]
MGDSDNPCSSIPVIIKGYIIKFYGHEEGINTIEICITPDQTNTIICFGTPRLACLPCGWGERERRERTAGGHVWRKLHPLASCI